MRNLFITILALLLAETIAGQDIMVTARLDTGTIFIGDQVVYTVTVEQPTGIILSLKPVKDTLVKSIEIIAGPLTDTSQASGNRLKIHSRYLVTSFDSGKYVIPPFYAEINDESGIRRFHSDYSFLEVLRVKIAPQDTSAQIFDIVGPYKAPLTLGEMLPWILLAIISGALVWGIIYLVRRLRKKENKPEVEENRDPAHITAFRELEKLKSEELWQHGETKPYYSRLTEIIRKYLEERYGVFSLEMTTPETLTALLKTGFRKDENFGKLKSVLTISDLVKFAKYNPDAAVNEKNFQDSWDFVDATRVREEVNAEMAQGKEEKRS